MPTGLWLYAYYFFFCIVVVESLLMIAVLRQLAALHSHFVKNDPNAGLPLGALAPLPTGSDLFGRVVSLAAARGRKTLLFFVSPGCGYCREVMKLIPDITNTSGFEMALVVNSSELRTRLFLEEHWRNLSVPGFPVIADEQNELAQRFVVSAVPHAVVVDEDGRIGGQGTPLGEPSVRRLLDQADQLRTRRWQRGQQGEPSHLATTQLVTDRQ
jgi:thioredoxin-related protein